MPRKHVIVRKILENVPPNHFLPRPYHLDLLDSVAERNTIVCKDENITVQFMAQTIYKDFTYCNYGKCMLVVLDDGCVDEAAKSFHRATGVPTTAISDLQSNPLDLTEIPGVLFLTSRAAVELCCQVPSSTKLSILNRVFLLILDECHRVLEPGHPYERLFGPQGLNFGTPGALTDADIDAIWNRDASHYAQFHLGRPTDTGFRILCLTSSILSSSCTDHLLAKRTICTLEDRLNCRLETASELINLLSLGAQPLESEIACLSSDDPAACDQQHPIRQTVLRLLAEAHSFLSDLKVVGVVGEGGTDDSVLTSGRRLINVPFYCLRAVAQCEAITRDLGVYCGCLIARVFLRHLYRLERARAAALEARAAENDLKFDQQQEHADDLLTRLLRYTATQLAVVVRIFQTASDSCMTCEEMRSLASPRVLQLIDHLKTLKPTASYRIEAVVRGDEGTRNRTGSDDDEADDRGSPQRGRRCLRNRSRSAASSTGFVAPHGFDTSEDEEEEVAFEGEDVDDTDSDSSLGSSSGRCSNSAESDGDATDVSMGLCSSARRRKPRKKHGRRSECSSVMSRDSASSDSALSVHTGAGRVVYRVLPTPNPTGAPSVPPLCGLVLVGGCQFSAYALPRFIEEFCNWDPELAFVRPGYFFVPGSSDRFKSSVPLTGGITTSQEQTVANFRCGGEVNLLVTTHSGLAAVASLPRCNFVATFHPLTSLASYLVAKSRLRLVVLKTAKARFVHFTDPQTDADPPLRTQFHEVERMLIQRCRNFQLALGEHDVDPDFLDSHFSFLPNVGLLNKSASKAIDVVNHYCARLPCNSMTRLAPRWRLIERAGSLSAFPDPSHACPSTTIYQCVIQLPINSPVRKVVRGDWLACKKLAKFSAAIRVGQLLFACGEVDSRGRPILKNAQPSTKCPPLSRSASRGRSPPRQKQSYLIDVPGQLSKCLPVVDATGSSNYLYFIDLCHLDTPLGRLQWEQNRQAGTSYIDFYPENENLGFGLLSAKSLPCIPEFSIFTRSGEETVNIIDFWSPTGSSSTALRFEKDCLVKFDLPNAYSQILIVPVLKDVADIDWDLVNTVVASYVPSVGDCRLPVRTRLALPALPKTPMPLAELLSHTTQSPKPKPVFHFLFEDFVNAVVTPTYRNVEQPPRYYVVRISDDRSPMTEFPSKQYANFADYYACKYAMHLTSTDQPLLDAGYTPLRLGLVVPRSYKKHLAKKPAKPAPAAADDSGEQQLRQHQRHKQLLIPELCHRHPLPATVWQKAICLPSVLYRLHHLLLADDLRNEIARSTGLGAQTPPAAAATTSDRPFAALRCPYIPSAHPPPLPAVPESPPTTSDPDVVRLTLSTSKEVPSAVVGASTSVLEKLLEESIPVEPDVDEAEESEEDAASVDSFEDRANGVRFFPPEDDDIGDCSEDPLAFRPSPTMILQSLTMLCAADFINLERLETIGDSFLKFAVTTHLYLSHPDAHEGYLSALRSFIVGNTNLYRLGCLRRLPGRIVGVAFEPHENWVPPGYVCVGDLPSANRDGDCVASNSRAGQCCAMTHQFLANKAIADCVEAVVGCYLTERGERSALKVLQWFGVECLPPEGEMRTTGSPWSPPEEHLSADDESVVLSLYHAGRFPQLEEIIGYKFRSRRLLLEAFTHSTCRDLHVCPSAGDGDVAEGGVGAGYERLEFLGDAVLDYVVTRFLYADEEANHTPGVLTDLRSALVNNNIFGALAVRWRLHTFLRAASPSLTHIVDTYVWFQQEMAHDDLDILVNLNAHDDGDEAKTSAAQRTSEELEVPKALGDIFESLAGAVFIDSGLCLNTVWRVFYPLMRERIERYSSCVAKSPVRRLLELCPDLIKFERPRTAPDGRLRVGVRVVGKGRFVGIGRTYRLAKSAAADLAYRRIVGDTVGGVSPARENSTP
ncbi:unnamed protein product [Mesocestoides corti]|uniref:Uncharacterized protein n=1 Tax=Mesocestoides corti TaxID=53468 RepID=A0A158QV99_MESCO|nr:unnamed protein product [Mesocestoides corti]